MGTAEWVAITCYVVFIIALVGSVGKIICTRHHTDMEKEYTRQLREMRQWLTAIDKELEELRRKENVQD